MIKIGIIGNSPEYFSDHNTVMRNIQNAIDTMYFHHKSDVVFNILGNIGVGEWAANVCLEKNIKYHIFLPSMPETLQELWFEDQVKQLVEHFKMSWAATIISPHNGNIEEHIDRAYENIVSQSDFILAFWNNMKQGHEYSAIKNAVENHKTVLNAMEDLKLITYKNL